MNADEIRTRLDREGWAVLPTAIASGDREDLRCAVFLNEGPGQRCLLDNPGVRRTALALRTQLIATGLLPPAAVAIQAIAFDKNPTANWKVTWHQDVMFPFARAVRDPAYTLPSVKDGVDYARPPRAVLEQLLAVRLHLDDCDASNGPLRVAPGSHRAGIYRSTEIPAMAGAGDEAACLAREGDALLMRPLLLHASSPATAPRHRRVLHVVYHTGEAMAEGWHRAVA